MGRKKHEHHEEHENHERWLVSYADFITLLFAFFVVLYASRSDDAAKMKRLADSLKIALAPDAGASVLLQASGNTVSPLPGKDAAKKGGDQEALDRAARKAEQRLAKIVKEMPHPPIAVINDGKRLAIRLHATSFFNAGEAVLKPDALQVLDAVGKELGALDRPVRVEGHTDSRAPTMGRFRSNWELSASRAVTVTEFLISAHNVAPIFLSAAGYADTRPIADNGTEQGREANRRIELVVSLSPDDPLVGVAP
jgi:chemotaxis protein MotB